MGHPMRIELTRVGLLVYLANHYTTRGAPTSLQCPGYDTNKVPFLEISGTEDSFITIIPRSSLTRRGNTCYGPIVRIELLNHFLYLKPVNYV